MNFFERLAQEKIEEAARRGEFENLANAGLKIDYQEYLSIPASQRMMIKLMRDARVVPREIELLNEIYNLKLKIAKAKGDAALRLQKELTLKVAEKDLRLALAKRQAPG